MEGCYVGNPYSINAVLYIEDLPTIAYAYNKILDNGRLYEFLNNKGELLVCYELYLKKQFDIAWNGNTNSRQLITRIIIGFMSKHFHATHSVINEAIKQILLEKANGILFIACFDEGLSGLFRRFDAELIDIELVSSLEVLLSETKKDPCIIDNILSALIYKVKDNENKRDSIFEYIERYKDTFERWDKESSEVEDEKVNSQKQRLVKAYKCLSTPNVSEYDKYEAAFELSDNLEFLQDQDRISLINIIETFFADLDLDQMKLERKTQNSFISSQGNRTKICFPFFDVL